MSQSSQPALPAWALFFLPDLVAELPGVGDPDDRVMSLWLADLGVNGLLQKDRRKAERADRRHQRRREKTIRHKIDGSVGRREPTIERTEDAVSEAAQAEALERAGVKD